MVHLYILRLFVLVFVGAHVGVRVHVRMLGDVCDRKSVSMCAHVRACDRLVICTQYDLTACCRASAFLDSSAEGHRNMCWGARVTLFGS